ncbi:MAG TPA: transporter substrate-binding domain-containing protein [Candidatus Acidoferrales bacterium]|jgi:polar amino acid transport system substrate-binding protein|nr:transporter substrate-binding domain-containing protein [Candidatus Acidoferrales bacterium]
MRKKMFPASLTPLVALVALCFLGVAAPGQQSVSPKSEPAVPKSGTAQGQATALRANGDLLAEIKRSGKLRVGVSEIVPWATHDKDGSLVGFEIDVAKKLARDMGVEPEFYPEEFRYLIPDLLAGRFDIIVSGLSINASRALQLDFSAPYNTTDVTLAVNIKAAGSSPTLQSFNKDTVTIGVLEGTTAEDMAGVALPNAKMRTYTDDSRLFDDLIQGKLEAAVADSPRPEIVAKLYPTNVVCVCDTPLVTYPAAFAVRRGNLEFVNFLNSWIEAHTVDKWLEQRRGYWFKTTDWAKDL